MSEVKVIWEGNMNFRGFDPADRDVLMDAAPVYGGLDKGIRPMELILISVGGCTGIEVGNILNKMRIPYDEFKIEVRGERAENPPKVFTKIWVKYILKGEKLTQEKVEKAIRLGATVYCSATNMLKKACPIEYVYEINGTLYKYDEENDNIGDVG